jgi:Glycosyltransferase sugar-binding region containing DXD motif
VLVKATSQAARMRSNSGKNAGNADTNSQNVAMAYYHHRQEQPPQRPSLLYVDSKNTTSTSSSIVAAWFRRPTTTTRRRSYRHSHQHQHERGILQQFAIAYKIKSIVCFSSSSSVFVSIFLFIIMIIVLIMSLCSTRTDISTLHMVNDDADPIATLFRHQMLPPDTGKTRASSKALRVFGPLVINDDKVAMAQQNMALMLNSCDNDEFKGESSILFSFSTTAQQREFLVQHGPVCQASFFKTNENDEQQNVLLATFDAYINNWHHDDDDDTMNHSFATELWKYCVLYTGAAHVFWNAHDAHALLEWNSNSSNSSINPLLASHVKRHQQQQRRRQEQGKEEGQVGGGGGVALLVAHHHHHEEEEGSTISFNQYMDDADGSNDDDSKIMSSSSWPWRIHHALFYVSQDKSSVCAEMMHWLVERAPLNVSRTATSTERSTSFSLPDVVSLSEYLGLLIHNDNKNNMNTEQHHWSLWSTQCRIAPVEAPPPAARTTMNSKFAVQQKQQQQRTWNSVHQHLTPRCPNHQFCCQAWSTEVHQQQQASGGVPSFLIQHPLAFSTRTSRDPSRVRTTSSAPYSTALHSSSDRDHERPSTNDYMTTVRLLPDVASNNYNNGIASSNFMDKIPLLAASPTFFDIMLENDCLPNTHDCFRCLKGTSSSTPTTETTSSTNSGRRSGGDGGSRSSDGAKKGTGSTSGGSCRACASVCQCYCPALCKIRPPPKAQPPQVWAVTKPKHRPYAKSSSSSSSSRLIPRIIHQTWFEAVNATRYPRQSRLVQSFVESGWEYHFYTDAKAAEFISTHFPPPVRQAYDALVPGAFKADLFRYCVLLIHGGLYADMDVLLTSNLDEVLGPNIGFMTARDEPGQQVGHGHCLWNGFIAAAPGHPFLAQTVETVVNNIRNRFTSVDYDDMLCPNPVLSVSHSFDVLFTTGPCILGASINRVLQRHAQTGFETGDLDIFDNTDFASTGEEAPVDGQVLDPRQLIPGRSILLQQNKKDMGAHRFTWLEKNLIVASTDLPDSSDDHSSSSSRSANGHDAEDDATFAAPDDSRLGNGSKKKQKHLHYSTTHENAGVYGLSRLYTDSERANQDIKIILFG